jgi:predicted GNAT superfamily acetyltransferase
MRVRDVSRDHLAAVHALNAASLPAVSEVSVDGFEWFLGVADWFRLVEIDGELAGFLLGLRPGRPYDSLNYRWFCERYRDFFYIDRLAVDDRFRRRGVASTLYADIERRARALDARMLACEVNLKPRNEVSLDYHAHHGFLEVGRQDTDDGAKRVSLMIKTLVADPPSAAATR